MQLIHLPATLLSLVYDSQQSTLNDIVDTIFPIALSGRMKWAGQGSFEAFHFNDKPLNCEPMCYIKKTMLEEQTQCFSKSSQKYKFMPPILVRDYIPCIQSKVCKVNVNVPYESHFKHGIPLGSQTVKCLSLSPLPAPLKSHTLPQP
ncbi:hypothetical protein DSO57_1008988 [Entomophthora muscae]|uniref:Uncharacterized protein n=1 Tax=Entomophthora muscae TaxID=34485 RepID=A0ACC2SVU1_9FUNG|nr:hypothetical protein DSO57_1008988 [Entomophthora muscae]